MAKRVAVIDIGSNAVRLVIYEKTSRFAFHLLYETKTKVRLSQDIYNNNGNLQDTPMQRTFDALKDFTTILKHFKARKTLCVATSALRDAPNKKEFITRVRTKLNLKIKVIDGQREAYLGAMACANLLPTQHNALSIDIGGGSTELTIINDKKISNNISLHLGTIRLKELFFDTNNIKDAIAYIDAKLLVLDTMQVSSIVGIGGTFRAVGISIMKNLDYPFKKLHAFEFTPAIFMQFLEKILQADEDELKNLNIKHNRLDIIKPGVLILSRIMNKLDVKNIITSGVGVREGVYLSDLLRNSKDKLPHNYNTSVRYILDTFTQDINYSNQLNKLSKEIFTLLHEDFNIDKKFIYELGIASKLSISGASINIYFQNRHSYQIVKSSLEFGFTHKEILLISTLNKYIGKSFPSVSHMSKYSSLLPDDYTLHFLIYILSLSSALLSHRPRNIDFKLEYKKGELNIVSSQALYLSKEAVKSLDIIKDFTVKISVPC
jgi:exopolyphosphatase/guanosine-5'-triphosphate,3'-diphosphate pyrophosphatase